MFKNLEYNFYPFQPVWLIASICVLLLVVLAWGCHVLAKKKDVPRRWVIVLAVLRTLAVVVFGLCMMKPVFRFVNTSERLPDMLVLLDASQSMSLPTGTEGSSRLKEVTGQIKNKIAPTLSDHYNLHYFTFDRNSYPVDPKNLGAVLPTGESTRYAPSIRAAWAYYRNVVLPQTKSVSTPPRVMLVSDGIDQGSEDAVEAARQIGVAVDTLAPSDVKTTSQDPQVSIAHVQGSRRVLRGADTRFLVTLRAQQASLEPVILEMYVAGALVLQREVVLPSGQLEVQEAVSHRPPTPGVLEYEFRVKPKNAPPVEDDKSRKGFKLSVNVVDEKTQVLVMQESWRWDFKFLRRVLEEDPTLSMTAFLNRGEGAFMLVAEPDRSAAITMPPQTQAELGLFDIIILSNPNPRFMSPTYVESLVHLVRDEGKSLVVIAGPNIVYFLGVPELHNLLPVDLSRESGRPVEGGVAVQLTPEGKVSPFFFAPGGKEASGTIIPAQPNQPGDAVKKGPEIGANVFSPDTGDLVLPPVDDVFAPLRKKPGATVLLEAADKANNNRERLIVMAEQTVGRGRVLYVGTDTLWKWNLGFKPNAENATPFTQFWQQALRALTPNPFADRAVDLFLTPERSSYEVGTKVVVQAELKSDVPLNAPLVAGNVVLPDGRQAALTFTAHPTKPNFYLTDFETTLPGQYKILANVTSDGKTTADVIAAIDVQDRRGELAATTVDRGAMLRIATMTGGKVINPNDKSTWPATEKIEKITIEQARQFDLWSRYVLVTMLMALLGADWVIRLLRGYV
jgi:hypothetical protein